MKSIYVLTNDQFWQALLYGSSQLGFIEELPEQGSSLLLEQAKNGMIITAEESSKSEFKLPASEPKVDQKPPEYVPVGGGLIVSPKVTPEEVQEALKAVMERVPRITTIRNWSEEHQTQALAYAKSGGKIERPEFIIEPAPRQRRSDSVSPPPALTPDPLKQEAPKRRGTPVTVHTVPVEVIEENHASDGPARGFFDDEPELADDSNFP